MVFQQRLPAAIRACKALLHQELLQCLGLPLND